MPLKIEGRREVVEDVVEEVRGDDITERQGGVARTNVVRVVFGVGSPPALGLGGRVGPRQAHKDGGANQCKDKVGHFGVLSGVCR